MPMQTKAVPEGYHTLTPMLIVAGAKKALEFYKRAFGAEEKEFVVGPDGRVMHAEVKIGNSILMFGDENPEMGCLSADSLKGSPASLYVYVENVDAFFDRAVKAGGKIKMPVADMFWGDRCGTLTDPFGFQWMIASHKEDLTEDEISKRGEQFFAAQKH